MAVKLGTLWMQPISALSVFLATTSMVLIAWPVPQAARAAYLRAFVSTALKTTLSLAEAASAVFQDSITLRSQQTAFPVLPTVSHAISVLVFPALNSSNSKP